MTIHNRRMVKTPYQLSRETPRSGKSGKEGRVMALNEALNAADARNVDPVYAVQSTGSSTQRQSREKEQKQERPPQKKVRDYFHPLSKAVEASNQRLTDRNLPYRFKVFKRWGEVFIELYILDANGKVKEKQRKNISQSDFNRIIDDVVQVEGLFFDHTV